MNAYTRSVRALRELADEIEQGGYGTDLPRRINSALSYGDGFDAGLLLNMLVIGVEQTLAGTVEVDDGDGPYVRGYAQAIEDLRRDALELLALKEASTS